MSPSSRPSSPPRSSEKPCAGPGNLSYHDAQVWAVVKLNQVPVVLSEDFNVGATLKGVLFLNPLEPDFDLSAL